MREPEIVRLFNFASKSKSIFLNDIFKEGLDVYDADKSILWPELFDTKSVILGKRSN